MKDIKIAYLGGGSKQWARIFMKDLALAGDIEGEIALYDIDKEAAIHNQKIGNIINENPNTISKWIYNVYENIDEALRDAIFVVISILPGTFEEMYSDVHTPEKYGIYQSVGDTVGPGGVLRSMRTVPIFQYFAQKIEKNCPNAWVLNFTNPMSICVKALYDSFPKIKAFGCCHEVFHTQNFLCSVLKEIKGIDINRKDIYTDISGINHFTWITKAAYKDIDILSLLDEFIDRFYIEGYNEKGKTDQYKTDKFACSNRVKMNLYQRYGILGAAGDRHLAEFMDSRWYLDSKEMVDNWKFTLTDVNFRIKLQKERIEESILMAEGKKKVEVTQSNEEAVQLIKAILGFDTIVSNVNLPNVGQISDLPLGAIVEGNAVFTNNLVKPVSAEKLPTGVKNLIVRNLYNIEELYEGIKTKNLDTIFSSFINQPLCSKLTLTQAKDLFNEMMNNTRKYLMEYFDLD